MQNRLLLILKLVKVYNMIYALPAHTFKKTSVEKQTFSKVNAPKVIMGQFYTRLDTWLTHPIKEFIQNNIHLCDSGILDPFAGDGHLLDVCKKVFQCSTHGLDINSQTAWPYNDSLLHIPPSYTSLICTNPPYLARHSASRKGVLEHLPIPYFETTHHSDIYQIALEKCLESARFVVAVLPETFILSPFSKRHLVCLSVLEKNPFTDTTVPTCVACFDRNFDEGEKQAKLYIDDIFILTLEELKNLQRKATGALKIAFNDPEGEIALRAVDGTNPEESARFMAAESMKYSRNNIKESSRLMTYLSLKDVNSNLLPEILANANQILDTARHQSGGLIFSPFKGNNKIGKRRRRIDYATARWALESAYLKITNHCPRFL
jgi:hypothetical protein